jgi:hypothetical protein
MSPAMPSAQAARLAADEDRITASRPRRPWVAMTIRSQPFDRAVSRIAFHGTSLLSLTVSHSTPAAVAVARIVSSSSREARSAARLIRTGE